MIAEINSGYRNFLAIFQTMTSAGFANAKETLSFYHGELFPSFIHVHKSCLALREMNQVAMEKASRHAHQLSVKTIWSMTVVGAASGSVGLALSILLSGLLLRPLSAMTRVTEQLGSTAGGLKQYRVYVLYRCLTTELRRMFLPRRAVTEPDVWVGEQRRFLQDSDIRQIAAFTFLYLLTLALGTGILAAYGYSLKESLFEFASALGTVGLSVGVTSSDAPAGLLWTETVGMCWAGWDFS